MTEKEQTRIFLLIGFFFVSFSLYSAWNADKEILAEKIEQNLLVPKVQVSNNSVKKNYITINTDKFSNLKINLAGGDIEHASLRTYKQDYNSEKPYVLLEDGSEKKYILQTDVLSRDGKRFTYKASNPEFLLSDGQDFLKVNLYAEDGDLKIQKTYVFSRGKHTIDIDYFVTNKSEKDFNGKVFGQIKQYGVKEDLNESFAGVSMYKGGAMYTESKPYMKVPYETFKSPGINKEVQGGWIAMVDKYFITAWVPEKNELQKNIARSSETGSEKDVYWLTSFQKIEIPAGKSKKVSAKAYIGPEIMENLRALSNGLEYTIDYGFLWPVASLIFWLMKKFYSFFGNWGWAVVAVTFTLKIAFYGLSAKSYRSMAKTKQLKPKLDAIEAKYANDKQKKGQEIIELYRKEKVNPLSGCLTMIVQIPVFIAFYYVLSESVELRHAPFIFWVQDLSAKDPFYVLPIATGLFMFIQQKLSPPPADPMQAKMFSLMPIIFTFIFINVPSGLTLYWALNSLLSIMQQWLIMRSVDKSSSVAAGKR